MSITQKCQYALRGLFELALREGSGPVKIGDVAASQAIPARFLENILTQLKAGGFVESVRGKDGGYRLAKSPSDITVGDVVRFVEGPLSPVDCYPNIKGDCGIFDDCVFRPLWEQAQRALEEVYDSTTLQDLINRACKNTGGGCKPVKNQYRGVLPPHPAGDKPPDPF